MKKVFFIAIIITFLLTASLVAVGFFASNLLRPRHTQPLAAPADMKITLIEGWTVHDVAQYLQRQGIVFSEDFLTAEQKYSADSYGALLARPNGADLEGFVFPDTYLIAPKNASSTPQEISDAIIKKSLDNFAKKFTPDMQAQAAADNMSVYQIMTLASIIEKETGRNTTSTEARQTLDDERKIIAGIFYNRLKTNMPLESDATVNYITKKNDPQATIADTQIDSPYNTYKYTGLPPGPICNPSLSSIMAALYPTKTDYYYFLHKQPSGEPIYSKTYQEHLRNKQRYLP